MVSCSVMRKRSLIAIPSAFDIKSMNHFIKCVWLLLNLSGAGENEVT